MLLKRKLAVFCAMASLSMPTMAEVDLENLDDAHLGSLSAQASIPEKKPMTTMMLHLFLSFFRDMFQEPFKACVLENGFESCDLSKTIGQSERLGAQLFIPMLIKFSPEKHMLKVTLPRNPYTGKATKFNIIPMYDKDAKKLTWRYIGEIWTIPDYQFKEVKDYSFEVLLTNIAGEAAKYAQGTDKEQAERLKKDIEAFMNN